jgi:hypothetical protein
VCVLLKLHDRGLSGPALKVVKILNIFLTFAKIKEDLKVVRRADVVKMSGM